VWVSRLVLATCKKAGCDKARISRAEHDEPLGSMTLKSMQTMAQAMGCRFVYAVVPEREVEVVIKQRAIQRARAKVKLASTHMALEAQSLSNEQLDFEIERLAAEITEKIPSNFWDDE